VASEDKFPIVGIGASAGGLEALEGLFKAMPDDTGMSFVVITHLARGQVSAMVEILGRYTRMEVQTAADEAVLEPNQLYVCPPDHVMTMVDGKLRLQLRADEAQRKPIDVFLSSLAREHGEAAIGILLSGGGSDGTLGIKAIKERGGLTLAQGGDDGAGPLQKGMPDTAIAAGVVDLVLSVEQMASRLADYARGFARAMSLPTTVTEMQTRTATQTQTETQMQTATATQTQIWEGVTGIKPSTSFCTSRSATTSVATRKKASSGACATACRCCRTPA